MDHRLFTAEQARDIVMYRHEQTKRVFLYTARVLAVKVIKEKGEANINDIRERMPIPEDIHPSALGAIFRDKRFQHTGRYTTAKHSASHARKVGIYTLKG